MNRNFINSGMMLATVLGAAVVVASAPAHAFSFTLEGSDNVGSNPLKVLVDITQLGGNIQYKVDILPETVNSTNNIGDLRGFFFDVADESLLSLLKIVNSSRAIYNETFSANNVINLGQGVNFNPDPGKPAVARFDAGFRIGENGTGVKGADDIRSIMFEVARTDGLALSLSDFDRKVLRVGVRATSVGPEDGVRGGSSGKIVGEVPTPALLPGLIGLGVAALRKKQENEVAEEV
ncbi:MULTISPECIES: PTPA-CTERM sorting domain-containing protein [Cyanophyceae]|uniref:PTPA-CTERM sorting domain-containing protein n=1 Tax=Cyanophyceae TaxID=3028117 RepID=UPI001685B42E|nr:MULTISPECIES: PTPA-CTERM sorting domain-containing protein [Cyanophyceae]MBD1918192.1 PTPA-CTERM sorting domain-containing protein [Phormidium sp. FACHB-77]MBD2030224.1 PTPA-CTERM sorting domain-containing protein [Phormidium sp. FACHB-322]MBD2051404.1 PTPA-CTERM sorting domain-containing protein [Leptolyngbya sp. FACHB-60]